MRRTPNSPLIMAARAQPPPLTERESFSTPVEKTKKFQGWCHRTGTRRKSVSPGRLATPIGSADLIFLSLGRPRLCKGGFLSSSAPVTHPLVPAGRASSALSVTPCITGSGGRDGDTNPKRVGGTQKRGLKMQKLRDCA